MTNVWSQLRITLRGLRRNPGFAAGVVLSLALGIGANSTIFTVVNAVLLRPLPYPKSTELVRVALGSGGVAKLPVPTSYFQPLAESNRTLTAAALYDLDEAVVSGAAPPEYVFGAVVSSDLARVLDVAPALGRFLTPQDQYPGARPVVVISHEMWQRQFGGDLLIINREMKIADQPVTVVGVMPIGFSFPPHAEYWRPLLYPRVAGASTPIEIADVVARAMPGVSATQVQNDLAHIVLSPDPRLPKQIRDAGFVVTSLHDQLFGSARPALIMLFGAVGLLLLIACANVTNLVMARTLERRREFALRVALGARRVVLVRDMLVESIVLAFAGGALGAVISFWAVRFFVSISPQNIAGAGDIGIDGRVAVFIVGLSTFVALIVGCVSAAVATRDTSIAVLGEGTARGGRGRFALAARRTLVVVQLAVAVVLLTGSGLLLKSLARITSVDVGFEPTHLLAAKIVLPRARYPDAGRALAFFNEVAARLRALPGVRSVSYGPMPLAGIKEMRVAEGVDAGAGSRIGLDDVGPDYFATFGIRLQAGRDILPSDNISSPLVAVLNAAASRSLFPNGGALGQPLLALSVGNQHPIVVGVSADVPQYDVAIPSLPEVFIPAAQVGDRPQALAIRVDGRSDAFARSLQREVEYLDKDLAVQPVSLERAVSSSLAPHRFTSMLLGAFAVLALILAIIGLYGVVAYLAAQRTREFGVRVALGAQRWDVVALAVREGVLLTGIGVSLGVVAALALSRLVAGLLYNVYPRDPGTVAIAASVLALVGLAAAYVPARRAAGIDPVIALRAE